MNYDDFPTINTRDLQSPVRTRTTDYSSVLFRCAGIQVVSVPCTVICIGFDLIFTLIALVIGGSNVFSCPIEYRIPIYLIVIATVNLSIIILKSIGLALHVKDKDQNLCGFFTMTGFATMINIFQIFNFVWVIVGSVWVFSIYSRVQHEQREATNYCQANVYQYAFFSIILQYIVPFVICCCQNFPLKTHR